MIRRFLVPTAGRRGAGFFASNTSSCQRYRRWLRTSFLSEESRASGQWKRVLTLFSPPSELFFLYQNLLPSAVQHIRRTVTLYSPTPSRTVVFPKERIPLEVHLGEGSLAPMEGLLNFFPNFVPLGLKVPALKLCDLGTFPEKLFPR